MKAVWVILNEKRDGVVSVFEEMLARWRRTEP